MSVSASLTEDQQAAGLAVRLPGLWCPTCGWVSYDVGGGRACHGEDHQRHDVMRPVWLRVTLDGPRVRLGDVDV